MLFEGGLNDSKNNIKGTLKIPGHERKYTFKMSLSDKVFECGIKIVLTAPPSASEKQEKVELNLK